MPILRFILFPFTILFYGIIRTRNFLYDHKIFGEHTFDITTISVGNLSFGGTGKTPHIEYLIRLLSGISEPGVLSRGYRRKSSGYLFANHNTEAILIGDEPKQIKTKFPETAVAVAENRVLGIPNLLYDSPQTNVILLDDCFQHRAVKPGLNILLTEYRKPFFDDFLAPGGTLREYKSAYKRADLIVVSKCPVQLEESKKEEFIQKIKPFKHQRVFFSYLKYGEIYHWKTAQHQQAKKVIFFGGIANTSSIESYLKLKFDEVVIRKYPDHHHYTFRDLVNLQDELKSDQNNSTILLSTEKDLSKLNLPMYAELLENTAIYILPVEVAFHKNAGKSFDEIVLNYVAKNE
jgi:tetraacyldisaccharide 4'-kinase